ncbi:MAG: hypothetical protein Q7K37_11600, partial [Dehalococcoidia bacterium]|nr:hypothetical protein [Dehalococcoidia bacterium]
MGATETSATRCTDGGVDALAGPAGVLPPEGEAPALVVALDDVVAGVVGAAGAAFEAADAAAEIGARNPKAGGASGAVRASPGCASRIRGVSAVAARSPASAALAACVSATRATSSSTARWMPGVVTFEVGCVADGAGGAPKRDRDAGASLVNRSAASWERATCSAPPLRGPEDAPLPPVLPVEKRGARSTEGDGSEDEDCRDADPVAPAEAAAVLDAGGAGDEDATGGVPSVVRPPTANGWPGSATGAPLSPPRGVGSGCPSGCSPGASVSRRSTGNGEPSRIEGSRGAR